MATKSETVTIRLDPRLRYLAALAARKQRHTMSRFIAWALKEALGEVVLGQGTEATTLAQEAEALWDTDAVGRLVKLGDKYPALLSYEEQVVWKRIKEARCAK